MGKNDDGGEDGAAAEVMMPEGFGSSFSTKEIRAKVIFLLMSHRKQAAFTLFLFQFVRKVYATLLSQLFITLGFISVFIFTPAIKNFYCTSVVTDEAGMVHCVEPSHEGFIIYIVAYVIFFITYFSIACFEKVRRKSPGNMIALVIFTLSLSVWVASISLYHDVYWVLMSIGITAALVLGLTLFACQTKIDFTGRLHNLFISCVVILHLAFL